MPRPVKDDPRDCFKTFRFTEAEITRLEARARSCGQNLSTYVRAALLGVVANGLPKVEGEAARLQPSLDPSRRLAVEQMRKVGVNLNQIARRMNEQRLPPPRELTGLLAEIRAYVRQVIEP